MGAHSSIEWTDATWNPIRGTRGMWHCTKVSPGCKFCYAERLNTSARHGGGPAYIVGADTLRLDAKILGDPLRWTRPRQIFVCSMTDLFSEDVPVSFLDFVWAVMWAAKQHTFQVLTKRSASMREYVSRVGLSLSRQNDLAESAVAATESPCAAGLVENAGWPPRNVHLGVSVESPDYLWRLDDLFRTPAAVRFLSAEPLLAGMNLRPYLPHPFNREPHCPWCEDCIAGHSLTDERWKATREDNHGPFLDWVIVGGESGGPPERALVEMGTHSPHECFPSWVEKPRALAWVRALRDQCQVAGVPFFFKQWGGPRPSSGGRLLDGRTWDGLPQGAVRV